MKTPDRTLSVTLIFVAGLYLGTLIHSKRFGSETIRDEYTQKLKDNQDMYEQQLSNLITYKDSLESKINTNITTIDSLNDLIVKRAEALDSIKHIYDEQIDNLNNMSAGELVDFFSKRY